MGKGGALDSLDGMEHGFGWDNRFWGILDGLRAAIGRRWLLGLMAANRKIRTTREK